MIIIVVIIVVIIIVTSRPDWLLSLTSWFTPLRATDRQQNKAEKMSSDQQHVPGEASRGPQSQGAEIRTFFGSCSPRLN